MKRLEMTQLETTCGGSEFWEGVCYGIASGRIILWALGASLGPAGTLAANAAIFGCTFYLMAQGY